MSDLINVAEDSRKRVERAVLIGVRSAADPMENITEHLDELAELVGNLGVEVIERIEVTLKTLPQVQLYVGTGKADEIVQILKDLKADVLVFDCALSPSQQRNWERLTKISVIDRQEVIIDIFADRARTREAVLQVELAQMEYALPRLTRAWTHLSRQSGGFTGARGDGEKQIELDRRLVRTKIAQLKKDLEVVRSQRQTQRKSRKRRNLPLAALVGYTNAGKSSLLKALSGAEVLIADQLFATLDPSTRKVVLPDNQTLLLTDTVGFVRKLPHQLVDAFKSTLEEAVLADFLILVLDISNSRVQEHWETTLSVLKELGAGDKDILVVFNKIDLADDPILMARARSMFAQGVFVSATTGEGMPELWSRLSGYIGRKREVLNAIIPPERYDLAAMAHQKGQVLEEKYEDDGRLHLVFNIDAMHRHLYQDYLVTSEA